MPLRKGIGSRPEYISLVVYSRLGFGMETKPCLVAIQKTLDNSLLLVYGVVHCG
jgi:hypothetical protein